jgi:DNA-binding NarL/FixJ family response regulator
MGGNLRAWILAARDSRERSRRCSAVNPDGAEVPIPIARELLFMAVEVVRSSRSRLRALRAGARGYLLKGHVYTDLLETIRAVHAGQKRVPPEVAAELAGYAGGDELTPREIEILRLIAGGNANKEIGARLGIAEETVKSHITNILSKLEASDRTHAVTIGLKRGIIDL